MAISKKDLKKNLDEILFGVNIGNKKEIQQGLLNLLNSGGEDNGIFEKIDFLVSEILEGFSEEELLELIKSYKEDIESKKQEIQKTIKNGEDTDNLRKELADIIREKKGYERKIKLINQLKKFKNDIEKYKEQLYTTIKNPKLKSLQVQKTTPKNSDSKKNNPEKNKAENKETKKQENVLGLIENLEDKEEILSVLNEKFDDLIENDKLKVCNILIKKGIEKEIVNQFFSKIKQSKLSTSKIDLYIEIDEILNPFDEKNKPKQQEKMEKNSNENKIKKKKKFLSHDKITKIDQISEEEDIDLEEFFDIYKSIYDKYIFDNGKTFRAVNYPKVTNIYKKIFSDNVKGEMFINLLKQNGFFPKHEEYFFIKYYPNVEFIISNIENINNLGKRSGISLLLRLLENKDKYEKIIYDLIENLINKTKADYIGYYAKKDFLRVFDIFFNQYSDTIFFDKLVELKNIFCSKIDCAGNIKDIGDIQKLFDSYMNKGIRGKKSEQKISYLLKNIDLNRLYEILEKDLNRVSTRKEYYVKLVLNRLEQEKTNIILEKGKGYYDKLYKSFETLENQFLIQIQDVEPEIKEAGKDADLKEEKNTDKLEYIIGEQEAKESGSNIDLEEEKQEVITMQYIIDIFEKNTFLGFKKLNKEFDQYDDDFKLDICLFLEQKNYLVKVKEYFSKINSKNLSKENIEEYTGLRSRLGLKKVVNTVPKQEEINISEDILKLYVLYMDGRIRGSSSRQRIEQLLNSADIKMFINIVEKDLKNFNHKKGYYFNLILSKFKFFKSQLEEIKGKEWVEKLECSIKKTKNCFEDKFESNGIGQDLAKSSLGNSVVIFHIQKHKPKKSYGRSTSKGKVLKGKEFEKEKINMSLDLVFSRYLKDKHTETTKQSFYKLLEENIDNNLFWQIFMDKIGDNYDLLNLILKDLENNLGADFTKKISIPYIEGKKHMITGFSQNDSHILLKESKDGKKFEPSKWRERKRLSIEQKITVLEYIESFEELKEFYEKLREGFYMFIQNFKKEEEKKKQAKIFFEKFIEKYKKLSGGKKTEIIEELEKHLKRLNIERVYKRKKSVKKSSENSSKNKGNKKDMKYIFSGQDSSKSKEVENPEKQRKIIIDNLKNKGTRASDNKKWYDIGVEKLKDLGVFQEDFTRTIIPLLKTSDISYFYRSGQIPKTDKIKKYLYSILEKRILAEENNISLFRELTEFMISKVTYGRELNKEKYKQIFKEKTGQDY